MTKNKEETEQTKLDKFMEEFSKLADKHDIGMFVLIAKENVKDEKQAIVYNPQDIMYVTATLKMTHAKFRAEVGRRIGEEPNSSY